MDILFTRRYKYTTDKSIDEVPDKIRSIADRRWYDFSINMTGRLKSDDSFKLKHKWSLAVIVWVETSPAYINGKLSSMENKTIIETSVRPNSALVLMFYLMILLFLIEVFGKSMFKGDSKNFGLIIFPAFSLVCFGLIQLFTIGIRNRFEKFLRHKPRK